MLIVGFKDRTIKGFIRVVTNALYDRVTIAVEGLLLKGFKGKVIIAFCDRLKSYYGSLTIILVEGAFGGAIIVAFCDRLEGYYGSLTIILIEGAFGRLEGYYGSLTIVLVESTLLASFIA